MFRGLVDDEPRTVGICRDVVDALDRGRNCLVLTQWTDHVQRLCDHLRAFGRDPLVLTGGVGAKARAAVLDALGATDRSGGLLLVATGSYLGEGFDCPTLDTLFLAFPLAFKGRIVQYVGRVLRTAPGKTVVEVHDYVDVNVPVLARMHTKRLRAFTTLGFDPPPRR
ncbi:MAG: DEAD/DEAH box helicase [Egibacteraceae bacterium]